MPPTRALYDGGARERDSVLSSGSVSENLSILRVLMHRMKKSANSFIGIDRPNVEWYTYKWQTSESNVNGFVKMPIDFTQIKTPPNDVNFSFSGSFLT